MARGKGHLHCAEMRMGPAGASSVNSVTGSTIGTILQGVSRVGDGVDRCGVALGLRLHCKRAHPLKG